MADDAQKFARELLEKMNRFSTMLEDLFMVFVKKLAGKVGLIDNFFKAVTAGAEAFAKNIGKALIDGAVNAAQGLVGTLAGLRDSVRTLRRLARKIIGLLQGGMNNLRAIAGQVIKLVKRFRGMFIAVIDQMIGMVQSIAPITALLSAINAIRRVLQAMFDWIADAGPVASLLRKIKKLARSFVKDFKLVKKELKPLPRQLRQLAAA